MKLSVNERQKNDQNAKKNGKISTKKKNESQTWPYEGCELRPNFGLRMKEFSFG